MPMIIAVSFYKLRSWENFDAAFERKTGIMDQQAFFGYGIS
jgi:hypothetical protein